MNQQNLITCLICKKQFKSITPTHLKQHDITVKEYIEKYNILPGELTSKNTKTKRSGSRQKIFHQKYGKIEGEKRWQQYRTKQAETNSYEYKKNKFGWTKEEYDNYNKNRACTKQNFIKRHGNNLGTKKWNEYCQKQKIHGSSLEWFVEKYGKEQGQQRWIQICNQKKINKQNFIRKYGDEIGNIKWIEFVNKRTEINKQSTSTQSQELFFSIIKHFDIDQQRYIHFNKKDFEYVVHTNSGIRFLDFYDTKTNKCIEYFGDYWHANPLIYNTKDNIRGKPVDVIWEEDKKRLKSIIDCLNCQIFIVWEKQFIDNQQNIIEQCKRFLNEN